MFGVAIYSEPTFGLRLDGKHIITLSIVMNMKNNQVMAKTYHHGL